MATNTQSQTNPTTAGFPDSASHGFSRYTLAFDEFAEPRTIPAHWDLSDLLVPTGLSKDGESRQASESASTNHPDR